MAIDSMMELVCVGTIAARNDLRARAPLDEPASSTPYLTADLVMRTLKGFARFDWLGTRRSFRTSGVHHLEEVRATNWGNGVDVAAQANGARTIKERSVGHRQRRTSASSITRQTDLWRSWVDFGRSSGRRRMTTWGGFLSVSLQARKCRERTFGSRQRLAETRTGRFRAGGARSCHLFNKRGTWEPAMQ